MKLFDLGGDTFERERTCDDGRTDGSGVGRNSGETSSSNEKVAWYGLPDAVLDTSEPAPDLSLLVRPPQFSLML